MGIEGVRKCGLYLAVLGVLRFLGCVGSRKLGHTLKSLGGCARLQLYVEQGVLPLKRVVSH